jgi:DNA-binding PadR family transcriptional regulator
MQRDGWIDETRGRAEDERRRTYRITAEGRSILRSEVERLEQLLLQVRPALAGGGRSGRR